MEEILKEGSKLDLLLMLSFISSLLFLLVAKREGYFSFPAKREEPLVPLPFHVILGGFLLFLFMELLLPSLIVGLTSGTKQGRFLYPRVDTVSLEFQGWLTLFSMLFAVGAVVLYCFLLSPSLRCTIWNRGGVSDKKIRNAFGMGVLSWLVCYPFVVFVGQTVSILVHAFFQREPLPVDQSVVQYLKTLMGYPYLFWCTTFLLVFVIPVGEELLFRGFIQTWLLQYVSRIKSIVVTAVLFACLHFSFDQGIANVEFLTALFVLSCFLGFIYERQGSLWASISLHAVFNAFNVLLIVIR